MADRSCRDYRELISAFIDGDSTREENERLRQHLATCSDCRATLDIYRNVGGTIRAMPAVHPPIHLTDSIYAMTIDAEPRRLFLITSRVGYSLAAVASVLLIFVVAAYLIIGGYQRGVEPAVASHVPGQTQTWPLNLPVEITFNKSMNQESVIAALGMQPPQEKDRLAHEWDGNTLIIGGNPAFKPDTTYEIKISTDATDKWGNQLKEPFKLAFTTSSTQTIIQTPTPSADPTESADLADPSPTAEPTQRPDGDVPTPTRQSHAEPTATRQSNPGPGPGTGSGTPVVPDNPDNPGPDPTAEATATPKPPVQQPTATPTEPALPVNPTMPPTPTPTVPATATVVPPTLTPAPTATIPATATATTPPAPTETPEPTPDTIAVVGAIGDVYWRDQSVQDRLGEAVDSSRSFSALLHDFQHGAMVFDKNSGRIYVLKFGTGWDMLSDPGGEYPSPEETDEPGIYIPGGVLGAIWANDSAIKDAIGYALTEYPAEYSGTAQSFEHGTMVATGSTVYVLYSDGTWDWFTHTSGS